MNHEHKLLYGLRNGDLVRIFDVSSGLDCNCICPECKSPLVARKGSVRHHHFAHSSDSNCGGGVESALHLLAKKLLSEKQYVVLPYRSFRLNRNEVGHFPQQAFRISSIRVEEKLGHIVPDLLINIYGVDVAVEIFVTHRVDEDKAVKLREMGLPAIEIDLSGIDQEMSEEELVKLIVLGGNHKYWVNFDLNEAAKLLLPNPLPIVRNNKVGLCVAGCPLPVRQVKEGRYSSPEDCRKCTFFLQFSDQSAVRCSGIRSQVQPNQ